MKLFDILFTICVLSLITTQVFAGIFDFDEDKEDREDRDEDRDHNDEQSTTERDTDAIWAEVFANSVPDENRPKDKYGFSKQDYHPHDLREQDKQFLKEMTNKINRRKHEAIENRIRQRYNETYHRIYDPLHDAQEAAQYVIDIYRRDFNQTYSVAEERVRNFITPLIDWLKRDANDRNLKGNKTTKEVFHKNTVEVIHKTLETHLGEGKGDEHTEEPVYGPHPPAHYISQDHGALPPIDPKRGPHKDSVIGSGTSTEHNDQGGRGGGGQKNKSGGSSSKSALIHHDDDDDDDD